MKAPTAKHQAYDFVACLIFTAQGETQTLDPDVLLEVERIRHAMAGASDAKKGPLLPDVSPADVARLSRRVGELEAELAKRDAAAARRGR